MSRHTEADARESEIARLLEDTALHRGPLAARANATLGEAIAECLASGPTGTPAWEAPHTLSIAIAADAEHGRQATRAIASAVATRAVEAATGQKPLEVDLRSSATRAMAHCEPTSDEDSASAYATLEDVTDSVAREALVPANNQALAEGRPLIISGYERVEDEWGPEARQLLKRRLYRHTERLADTMIWVAVRIETGEPESTREVPHLGTSHHAR